MRQMKYAVSGVALMAMAAGCATSPKGQGAKNDLLEAADAEVKHFYQIDKTFPEYLNKAAGYAVFPNIGKGGLLVGGSYGKGVLYYGGKAVGYADITKVAAGGMAGGESVSKIYVFLNKTSVLDFMNGEYDLTADATVVAAKDGAAAAMVARGDTVVFIDTKGGAMVDASAGAQHLRFEAIK